VYIQGLQETPSWEANSSLTAEESPKTQKIHYRVHVSLSRARWIHSTYCNPISLRSFLTLSSHLQLCLSNGVSFSFSRYISVCISFFAPMVVTWLVLLILLGFITLILSDGYQSRSPPLCNFIQPCPSVIHSYRRQRIVFTLKLFKTTIRQIFLWRQQPAIHLEFHNYLLRSGDMEGRNSSRLEPS
jgi:hypothetical protein